MTITDDLRALEKEALAAIDSAATLDELESARIGYLGKKGSLTTVLRGLGGLSAEERPTVGKVSNEVRQALESALDSKRAELEGSARATRIAAEVVDVTLPGRRHPVGRQHVLHQVVDEIVARVEAV